MTAIAHDGNVKWYWLPAVAAIATPTLAEMTAGTLVPEITNYDTPASESEVDTSGIDDVYDTSVVGTSKAGPIVLTMKRDDTSEVATWDLFVFRDTGFLVKLPFGGGGAAGAPAADDKAEVYPAQVGQKRPEGYGRNTTQKFMVSFYVTSDPDIDAAIVA
jgi:hypothetical protein